MKKIKAILIGEESGVQITDATCDICGNSCMKGDEESKNFEGMELTAHWGFWSNNKDLEKWSAEICEDCVDKHLKSLINFKINKY